MKEEDKKQKSKNKNNIELIEDSPFGLAIAGYNDWITLTKKSRFDIYVDHHDRVVYDSRVADYLYNEAVKIIEPKSKEFKNIKQEDLYRILNSIQSNKINASGLYLSALLNATELQEMDAVFEYSILGYRMKPGKRLIARKGSKIAILGDFCNGDIINFGSVYDSISTEGGVQINFGKVFIFSSKGGIQINFGERNYMIGNKGIQIDFGDIYYMETKINRRCYKRNDFEKKSLLRNLESKLRDIEKLKNLKDHPDKAIQSIKVYDWRRFEQEVLALDRQIGNT